MHKRSTNKLQQRKIQTIILNGSYHDKQHGETVSKLTREEVMGQLREPVEIHLVPNLEKGEVLIDSRGSGSLQAMCKVGNQDSQKAPEKGSYERCDPEFLVCFSSGKNWQVGFLKTRRA